MANSTSLDAFVRSVKRLWPTATVWTKGDRAHESSPSDHNNDDTAGVRPEQVDADTKPEVRAGDVPTLGGVTMAELDELRERLTTRPTNQRRGKYAILRQTIWRKRNGWKPERYSGEYHGHLHWSIDAADDENGAPWDIEPWHDAPTTAPEGDDDMNRPILGKLTGRSTVWKGTGEPGSLMALHSERAYMDIKGSLSAVEFHYGDPHKGDAGALVDVLGTLPRHDGETGDDCYARSVKAVEDAG